MSDASDDRRPEGDEPRGTMELRTTAMPKDTNVNGDIFGGWILSQMDIAGANHAAMDAEGRVVTVGLEAMHFLKPVAVGDVVCCYCETEHRGRTSLGIWIEVWARKRTSSERYKVTEGRFTYVAIDDDGRPRPLPEA